MSLPRARPWRRFFANEYRAHGTLAAGSRWPGGTTESRFQDRRRTSALTKLRFLLSCDCARALRPRGRELWDRVRVRRHRICERSDSTGERDDCVPDLGCSARELFHPLTERVDRAGCAVAPLASRATAFASWMTALAKRVTAFASAVTVQGAQSPRPRTQPSNSRGESPRSRAQPSRSLDE